MALYFVATLSNPDAVLAAAKAAFPSDVHEIAVDKFFVRFDGTTVELGEALGVNEGKTGNAIILLVTAYHGRAPKSVWEWVAQNLSKK